MSTQAIYFVVGAILSLAGVGCVDSPSTLKFRNQSGGALTVHWNDQAYPLAAGGEEMVPPPWDADFGIDGGADIRHYRIPDSETLSAYVKHDWLPDRHGGYRCRTYMVQIDEHGRPWLVAPAGRRSAPPIEIPRTSRD